MTETAKAPPWAKDVNVPITDTARANAVLRDLAVESARGNCRLARGRTHLAGLIPGHALVIHELWPTEGDIQDMKRKGATYKAMYMRQIADVAGIRAAPGGIRRIDDGRDQHLVHMEVTICGRDLNMRHSEWSGSYLLDVRDGSARVSELTPGDLKSKREHIVTLAETGAFSRAVVSALSLARSSKVLAELYLPILIPVIEIHLASAAPEVQQAVSLAAIQASMGIFGPSAGMRQTARTEALPAPAADDPDDGDGSDPPEDDELPFDEEPPEDADFDRPITKEEQEKLHGFGVWRKPILKEHGWQGEGQVMLSTYNALVEKFGGAQ